MGNSLKTQRGTKAWSRPELVILSRAQPEEAVLTACKTTLFPIFGSEGSRCYAALWLCMQNSSS